MPTVSYHVIVRQIGVVLKAASTLTDVPVLVERDPMENLQDTGRSIGVYLENRRPDSLQSLSAGKRTRFFTSVSVWCIGFSMSDFDDAAKIRDDLIAAVELVLMSNRTLNDAVATLNLMGGSFSSARADVGPNAWCAMGEILVECEVSAINS